ncbi:hypothetical protein SAMN05421541_10465 [Actinoplanes philippinensis]|uniref:Uncharacterized protein n=2 Tax=Actinoplanes philippinensis TaxID=35752 RepID=A0A1I2E067_9ACTN|nr:hypothetical protein SAMN05421541_10465 [Actinoplanes philippinensis]
MTCGPPGRLSGAEERPHQMPQVESPPSGNTRRPVSSTNGIERIIYAVPTLHRLGASRKPRAGRSRMISTLFQPLPLTVGGLVLVAFAVALRRRTRRASYSLLLPAAVLFLAALDDWYVTTHEPEANIRVDVALLLALMLITTLAGIICTVVFAGTSRPSAGTGPQSPLPHETAAQ